MAKAPTGWKGQSLRHSNARKYGRAGGNYASKAVQHRVGITLAQRDAFFKSRDLRKINPPRTKWGEIHIEQNPNGSYTLTDGKDKQTYYFYSKEQAIKKFKKDSNYKWQKAKITTINKPKTRKLYPQNSPYERDMIIDTIDATREEKNILKNLNYEYRPAYNMWSVQHGETNRVMIQTGYSRKKSDALIMKALNKLEQATRTD